MGRRLRTNGVTLERIWSTFLESGKYQNNNKNELFFFSIRTETGMHTYSHASYVFFFHEKYLEMFVCSDRSLGLSHVTVHFSVLGQLKETNKTTKRKKKTENSQLTWKSKNKISLGDICGSAPHAIRRNEKISCICRHASTVYRPVPMVSICNPFR